MCDTVAVLYGEGMTFRQISDEIELATIKVRKLLITAGVYRSNIADEVNALFRAGVSVKQIQAKMGLSAASVNSYLPYTKAVYKTEECSVLADRIRLCRARKAAVEKLKDSPDTLWECLTLFAGYPFKTSKGLSFTYTIKGNELFVSRKKKSITRATVKLAYEKAIALGDMATGPKTLGCFGASYLYPVFVRLGVISPPLLNERMTSMTKETVHGGTTTLTSETLIRMAAEKVAQDELHFLSKEVIEQMRKQFPKGCTVILDKMRDPDAPPVGMHGTVSWVDDAGSIVVNWNDGNPLNVVYGIDRCHVASEEELETLAYPDAQ